MPPIRMPGGRASKACEGCRKGKTRCYPDASGACLRCNTLNLTCSLQEELEDATTLRPISDPGSSVVKHDCRVAEERLLRNVRKHRLDALESTVSKLTKAIGLDAHTVPSNPTSHIENAVVAQNQNHEPPMLVIRHAVSEIDDQPQSTIMTETIVDKGFVTVAEAMQLLMLFQSHYKRWITLREDDIDDSSLDFWASPLLLCVCCLVAIRHWSGQRARGTADALFDEAQKLLQQQLLQSPQSLSFFQSVLVLSLWSTSIGQKPLSMDSWMITGFAIQHSLASEVFVVRAKAGVQLDTNNSIGKLLVWNRICLSHLHACISIRRKSMVSNRDIDYINNQLPLAELTNFEIRMVAELNLYWNIHESIQTTNVDLKQAQITLQSWKQKWSFLLSQPRSQFLKMGYQFAQLLIFEHSLNNKSAAVRESLVFEMVRLSSAILQLAMDTTDEYTRYLTDHVYHMITFAAVTLCRLLRKYESQLRVQQSIDELDTTVLSTGQWLVSLGTESHIGSTMGRVVDAVHRKLRPALHIAMQQSDEVGNATPDQAMFPELLGIDVNSLGFDWDAMVPDWQSLASDEAMRASSLQP